MKQIFYFFVTLLLVELVGCASGPKLPKTEIPKGANVGIVIYNFPNKLTHLHRGITIFNYRHSKTYPTNVDIKQLVSNQVYKVVAEYGFQPIILELEQDEIESVANLVVQEPFGVLKFSPDAVVTLKNIKNQYDVDLLLIYECFSGSYRYPVIVGNTTQWTTVTLGNYGLYSHWVGRDKYDVFSFLKAKAVTTENPTINTLETDLSGAYGKADFVPKDKKILTPEELERLESKIVQRIESFVNVTVERTVTPSSETTLNWVTFLQ